MYIYIFVYILYIIFSLLSFTLSLSLSLFLSFWSFLSLSFSLPHTLAPLSLYTSTFSMKIISSASCLVALVRRPDGGGAPETGSPPSGHCPINTRTGSPVPATWESPSDGWKQQWQQTHQQMKNELSPMGNGRAQGVHRKLAWRPHRWRTVIPVVICKQRHLVALRSEFGVSWIVSSRRSFKTISKFSIFTSFIGIIRFDNKQAFMMDYSIYVYWISSSCVRFVRLAKLLSWQNMDKNWFMEVLFTLMLGKILILFLCFEIARGL